MTGEIVNLRRVRKQKQRADLADQAAANRVLHGRAKAERRLDEQENSRVARVLDAHRLEPAEREDDHRP